MKICTATAVIAIFGVMLGGATSQAAPDAGRAIAADRPARMTEKDAKFYIEKVLKRGAIAKYWRQGHEKKIHDCKSLSPLRVRCKVSWYYKDKLFIHGGMAAYYKANNPDQFFIAVDMDVDRI